MYLAHEVPMAGHLGMIKTKKKRILQQYIIMTRDYQKHGSVLSVMPVMPTKNLNKVNASRDDTHAPNDLTF